MYQDPTDQHRLKQTAPLNILTAADQRFVESALGGYFRPPDLTIAPDGEPYLYRWHVIPRNPRANTYLHVQVASDPERPLHDHPWDNTSVILSGAYDEIMQPMQIASKKPRGEPYTKRRERGDVVHRKAETPHRLILPDGERYTMTLFSTGPKVKEWGFWLPADEDNPQRWVAHDEVTEMLADGRSIWTGPHLPTT